MGQELINLIIPWSSSPFYFHDASRRPDLNSTQSSLDSKPIKGLYIAERASESGYAREEQPPVDPILDLYEGISLPKDPQFSLSPLPQPSPRLSTTV